MLNNTLWPYDCCEGTNLGTQNRAITTDRLSERKSESFAIEAISQHKYSEWLEVSCLHVHDPARWLLLGH